MKLNSLSILFLVFLLLFTACAKNDIPIVPTESIPPQSQFEAGPLSGDESSTKQQTKSEPERLRYPLVKYKKIEDNGPKHVLKIFDMYNNKDSKPINEYPELKPFWDAAYERINTENEGENPFMLDGQVAEFDLNEDGQNDYIIMYTSFFFGQVGGYYSVLLRQPDGTLKEIGTDNWMYRGLLAAMDSQTNGLYDLAQSATRYHQLIQYDGADKYVKSNPELPHIEKVLCSPNNWDIKGNKIIVEYSHVEITGAGEFDGTLYYIGMVSEPLSDYLIDPVLWACDSDYNLITLNELAYGTTLQFVGELKAPGITAEEIVELLPERELIPQGYLFDDDMFIVVSDD